MDKEQAKRLIIETFENPFNKNKFTEFIANLLKTYDRSKTFKYHGNYIPAAFGPYIDLYERIGQYTCDEKEIDILIVYLKKETSLERARTMQRNFVAWYLKGGVEEKLKDAALVAYVSPDSEDWRFSLVKMEYRFEDNPSGKKKIKEEFTPAKRWSFLVGKNEKSHTAQSRFLPILENDNFKPTLEVLEEVFNVEKVTKEFFDAYAFTINEVIIKSLDKNIDFNKRHSFAQQLLSRILFLYFLQKKGWLKWKNYEQDKQYISNLWLKYKNFISQNKHKKDTFYSIWLSSLFFGAFNKKSHMINVDLPEDVKESFTIMPFLNGGLFTKNELDEIDFIVKDVIFEWLFEPDITSSDKKKGFLQVFNFTIDEALPIDVEVAVDPEMLGKVYESLIVEEEKGEAGIFYTPRIEIDLMCRLSLLEYLHNETNITKTELSDFIFSPQSIRDIEVEKAKVIKSSLDNIKIVDPAVGSASFLVGMMNILVEIHSELIRKIEGKEENLFALKQKIIMENLYGVDVKDWAVMVGELRLWLSLIMETNEMYMDIYNKPLLPNLSFKMRQGDSLVEEIGGIQISLRGDAAKYIPFTIKNKIQLLIDKKRAFFSGQISANQKEALEIENYEQEIFSDIIKSKIDEIDKKIAILNSQISYFKGRKNLYNEEDVEAKKEVEKFDNQIKILRNEKIKYENVLSDLTNKTKKDYFLWEVDFAEVFAEKGGFDIVIGNPPYVRQELIAPPLENKSNYSDDDWRELKIQYKEKLISSVKSIWKEIKKIDKKSDLYVYFYFHGLSLLKDGGVFCFINSNSWLDVGYGAGLQEFLLKNMKPIYIIDNLKKRSFAQADVNTIIVLIQKPKEKLDDYIFKFIAFKKPFEEIVNSKILKRIEEANEPIFDDENFRIFPKTKKELLLEGVDTDVGLINELPLQFDYESFPYIGNKWGGKYLRAPEIYFKILEKGKGKLVRLGDITEVEGYIHGFNVGEKFEKTFFIESIEQAKEIILKKESKGVTLFGVKKTGNSRVVGDILIPRMIGNRFLTLINEGQVLGQKFYKIILNNKDHKIPIGCFLNSSVGCLIIEVTLLSPWGLGALSANSRDIKQIYVAVIKGINKSLSILNREIHSIFTELGFDPKKPIREQEPNPLPDRKALDDIVFDALGLTEEERKEVYWAVAELVKNRLEKAKSV